MFTNLMKTLVKEFQGDVVYLPDALYDMVKEWTCVRHKKDPRKVLTFKYQGKTILPYNEQKILEAYQSCPIVIPERILEQTYIIECSLVTQETEEPEDFSIERPFEPEPPKQQREDYQEPQAAPKLHLWGMGD